MENPFASRTASGNQNNFLFLFLYGHFFQRLYLKYAEVNRGIAAWMQVNEKASGEWRVASECGEAVD